ncbi:BON domain-containing protein [Planctomycetes bacterium K23_9]|uniref:Periplasmic protein n=1 Tax=Stieleria marina TaxID=1930275 RepID=A0A517NR53_9BACT|nr:periplasmic protein [Planctomycetes bacterium K23_9]
MRRKYLAMVIVAAATFGPSLAWGGDREIAEQIIQRLQTNRESGALKDFTLDMKVDKGVVMFRGNVNAPEQKLLVLQTARDIEGINDVVDHLTVTAAPEIVKPQVMKPAAASNAMVHQAVTSESQADFSLREALAEEARQIMQEDNSGARVAPVELATTPISGFAGDVRPVANVEFAAPGGNRSDDDIQNSVIGALSRAQKSGALKGFGVDVKSSDGVVWLKGRAASSAQRSRILQIAEATPGVQHVRNSIRIPEMDASAQLPEPPALRSVSTPARSVSTRLSPVAVDPVPQPIRDNALPRQSMHVAQPIQASPAPYRMTQQMQAQPVQATMGAPMMGAPSMGAPVMGQPVPVGGYSGGGGAPRYDSPNLPNYAWPGYAASPNYAALTYPQQYSPSAWPYIGPFYPYPQVPLGWRKVSLEWDDGWWQLDFSDR